jgi:Xaa-Pro aminopeptidase
MFQTFESSSSPDQGPPRLIALRVAMAKHGVDAFFVPRADAHQGEYVAPRDTRLAWLTGFTGSAGFCIATTDQAGVFIDGRYRVQVRDQIAADFTAVHWPEISAAEWIAENLHAGAKVGFDPWLHTVQDIKDLTAALDGMQMCPTPNLIDAIWNDQPDAPIAAFFAQDVSLAGEDSLSKRARLVEGLKADTVVITLPDSIAWLLNIRGADIERNPVPQAFAILFKSGAVDLFAGSHKADAIAEHLGTGVKVHDIAAFIGAISALAGTVQIDPKTAPDAVRRALTATVVHAPDPCLLPKAIKTNVEIAGARAAARRDGVAMVRFLAWLDAEAPKGHLTEIDVVKQLESFRRDTNALRDISFETICGAGPHGAIVHYRVTEDTNSPVKTGELLLVDSGGQYVDGTTDITRTVIVGTPTDEHRMCYTRVLQGMIALSRAQFPTGVGGQHLDALARFPLWTAGMDYDHGTGHGVGSYLSVHEGPQGISRRSTVPLEVGMILSNEPGYYREGAFGIRIENLITVVRAPKGIDDRDMLSFETLTLVPLDRRLIDLSLLSQTERDWIDQYHRDTVTLLGPLIDGAAADWLTIACAPL